MQKSSEIGGKIHFNLTISMIAGWFRRVVEGVTGKKKTPLSRFMSDMNFWVLDRRRRPGPGPPRLSDETDLFRMFRPILPERI